MESIKDLKNKIERKKKLEKSEINQLKKSFDLFQDSIKLIKKSIKENKDSIENLDFTHDHKEFKTLTNTLKVIDEYVKDLEQSISQKQKKDTKEIEKSISKLIENYPKDYSNEIEKLKQNLNKIEEFNEAIKIKLNKQINKTELKKEILEEVKRLMASIQPTVINGGGGSRWGSITGTLSEQKDLQSELDGKVKDTGDTMTGELNIIKSQVGTDDFFTLQNNGAFANGGVSVVGRQGSGNFDMYKLNVEPGSGFSNTKLEEYTANSSKVNTLRRDVDVNGNHRLGDIVGGNYTEIESDGTLEFNGEATVWEDLNFDVDRSGGPAVSQPDYVLINNVVYREFTQSNNQFTGAAEELPHKYKLGEKLYPHFHLFLKAGESAGTTGVTFTIYWELKQSTGTTNGNVSLTATSAELTANGTNKLTLYDSAGFDGSAELGAQLSVTIARTGGDAGDVIVTTYGVHYLIDTAGSRLITTK